MTEHERVMSSVAGRPGRAEHDVIVVGNLTVDDVVHANGETTMAVSYTHLTLPTILLV